LGNLSMRRRVHQDVAEAVKAYEATMGEYEEAVAAAKEAAGEDGEPEEVPEPDFSEKPMEVLGGRARAAMAEGKEVPNDLLVDFIIEKVRGLEGAGYVLDGFPSTVEQAKALEEKLAGVHDVHVYPKPQPPASRLAPMPPEDEKIAEPLPSALTLHVRLHLDKELRYAKRARYHPGKSPGLSPKCDLLTNLWHLGGSFGSGWGGSIK